MRADARRPFYFFQEGKIAYKYDRKPRVRANRNIRVSEIRVIDGEGEQLGVMATEEALKLAEEQGLDLVEVSPTAKPPVCRIMDFGKYSSQRSQTPAQDRGARLSVQETARGRISFEES